MSVYSFEVLKLCPTLLRMLTAVIKTLSNTIQFIRTFRACNQCHELMNFIKLYRITHDSSVVLLQL
jgi:hypothetical protein